MKKNLFMVAAVALMAFTACNKEEFNDCVDAQAGTVEFVAGFDIDTKTTLDGTKTKTLWAKDDKISINGFVFKVSELIDGGISAKFVNDDDLVDFKAPYTAYYPANVTEIPAEQKAYADNFDPNAVLEKAESDDHNLSFQNMTSLLKFQVSAACKTVILTSDDILAGADSKSVTISGAFVAGEDYYVAVLPGTKSNFTIIVDGYAMKSASSVDIANSTIADMKTLIVPGDWIMTGEVGDIHMTKSEAYTSLYVAKNVTLGTGKSFKFQNKDKSKVVGAWGTSGIVDCKEQVNFWYGSDATSSYAASISVSTAGEYDVYFSPENLDFLIIKAGVEEIESEWSMVGWIGSADKWNYANGFKLKYNYVTTKHGLTRSISNGDYFLFVTQDWASWIGSPGDEWGNDGRNTTNYTIAVGKSQTVNVNNSYNNQKAQFHMNNSGTYKIEIQIGDKYSSSPVIFTRIN